MYKYICCSIKPIYETGINNPVFEEFNLKVLTG